MTTAERIASWIYRDLSLRGGFREVTDQVGPSGGNMIVDFWAKRIEEEIGDNRFIKALEEIANDPANAVTYFEDKWRTIAKRALLPARHAEAAAAGVTMFAADSQAVQLDLPTPNAESVTLPAGTTHLYGTADEILRGEGVPVDLTVRSINGPSRPSPEAPPAIDLDDFS